MSDADLALFQRSLPRLINTRQGNLIIARTMRGLAKYQQGQAAIAASVANREMTPADARKALSELENPLQAFKTMANDKPSVVGGGIDIETQSLIDKYAGD
jgi:flagellar protein FlgJ